MCMRMTWDDFFIKQCNLIAERSKDESNKIGCVIVKNTEDDKKTIVSMGYNCFPRNITDNFSCRQNRPTKYFYFSHAEANALSNALRNGISVNGCRLYLNKWIPCADCARLIIQSGIKQIITPDMRIADRWKENNFHSLLMLFESQITISYPNKLNQDRTLGLLAHFLDEDFVNTNKDYLHMLKHDLDWVPYNKAKNKTS